MQVPQRSLEPRSQTRTTSVRTSKAGTKRASCCRSSFISMEQLFCAGVEWRRHERTHPKKLRLVQRTGPKRNASACHPPATLTDKEAARLKSDSLDGAGERKRAW